MADLSVDQIDESTKEAFSIALQAARASGRPLLTIYERSLGLAWAATDPVFGRALYGKTFRRAASNPSWLASSLLFNAQSEIAGSKILIEMAAVVEDSSLANQFAEHAADEQRHGRWYITIVDLIFPGAMTDELRCSLKHDDFTGKGTFEASAAGRVDYPGHPLIDEIAQINLVEIRTLFHQMLQKPFLEGWAPVDARRKLDKLTTTLLSDEKSHIRYTAELLEDFAIAQGESALTSLLTSRLSDLDSLTRRELRQIEFH